MTNNLEHPDITAMRDFGTCKVREDYYGLSEEYPNEKSIRFYKVFVLRRKTLYPSQKKF